MLTDVEVRPAQAKDLSELATLACSAFKHDPIYSMLHPYRALDPTSFRDWKHRIICSCFYDPLYSLYVLEGNRVLAELGKEKKEKEIVGYVVLRWHRDHDREWEWRRKQTWVAYLLEGFYFLLDVLYAWLQAVWSMDYEACRRFNQITRSTNIKPADLGPDYLELLDFSVYPDKQGKGYGSKLLKHCISIATAVGLPIVLEANPQNRNIYDKHGFRQDFGTSSFVTYQTEPFDVTSICMVWKKSHVGLEPPSDSNPTYRVMPDKKTTYDPSAVIEIPSSP